MSRAFPHVRRLLSSLSYAQGAAHPPLTEKTFSQFFAEDILAKHSDRTALICHNERNSALGGPYFKSYGTQPLSWTFQQFDEAIEACAAGLVSMGVEKGDRVGVVMGNNR